MKRILVVDDNETFRLPLSATLQSAGYEVETAAEGGLAVKLHRKRPFDLVITDLVMPDQEGLETIMQLRQFQPDLRIIAISGDGRMDASNYLPLARKLGAGEILAKPFTAEQILEAIARMMGS